MELGPCLLPLLPPRSGLPCSPLCMLSVQLDLMGPLLILSSSWNPWSSGYLLQELLVSSSSWYARLHPFAASFAYVCCLRNFSSHLH